MKLKLITRCLMLLSFISGAAILYMSRILGNYDINGAEYHIPSSYAGRATQLKSMIQDAASISGGFDPGGPFLFVHFDNEELKATFPSYISKYGERGFNTTFSVQAFETKEERLFADYFTHYFPELGDLLEVEYLFEEGLYRYRHVSRRGQKFLGTLSSKETIMSGRQVGVFFSCTDWGQEVAYDSCDFTVRDGNIGFSFRLSYANLHLYQELQDYFFTKLESWRVK